MAFNFPNGASNGDTHTASNGTVYRYNGTTWIVDSVATTTNFDTKYLNTNGDGILSGSVAAQLPSGTISGSTQIANLGYVSSSTVDTIQVMTTASYQAITPVSGTLYIIQG
jgi:hypothetical protein